eukprot:TRINITY_DN2722_c0_g1_i1.p1 TRINITY_DN2722_c0_g1~~TRINITY_DN2722_c0_g1_i1.p1  ORF type:complete len:173 (-),score=53.44 TRINITY_DN2722_c0_g1_i1:75-593(-)
MSGVAPWDDIGSDDISVRKVVKDEIFRLHEDEERLLNPGNGRDSFEFDFSLYVSAAQAAVDLDPVLAKTRHMLVPERINEQNFWKNYFFCINQIKTSHGVLAKQKQSEDALPVMPQSQSSANSVDAEFVSDGLNDALSEQISSALKNATSIDQHDDTDKALDDEIAAALEQK